MEPDRTEATPARPRHRMVARLAEVLELVARERTGLSLTEIAQRTAAPVSSIQGLVNGLVDTGYLVRRDRRYILGPAPYVLNLIAQRPPITVVRHSDLETLHRLTGRTAVLAIRVGREAVYIDHVTDDPRFAFLAETHAPRPLLRTACGRALMAHMDRREMHDVLRDTDRDDTGLVESFLAEIPTIRREGLAMTRGLTDPGYWTVAVPAYEGGHVAAAVGLSGTPAEMADDELGRCGATLLEHVPTWQARALEVR